MQNAKWFALLGLGCLLLAGSGSAQTTANTPPQTVDRASAYYNFAMGHLYAELAETYAYRSEYVNKAIDYYKAALKADPSASFIAEELTDLYVQAGKLRDAVVEAEDMLRRSSDNLEARRILGRIYSRLIGDPQQNRIDENMLHKAIEQYTAVVQKESTDVDSWVMLGKLYNVAQDSLNAEKAYKKALNLDPNNDAALSGLATVYARLGDSKSAVEMWRRLADQNPSPQTLRALASGYEEAHDYASAVQTLRRALELAPRNLELKSSLAEDLLLADQPDEALKLYNELAQADPKDARLQLRLSQIYRQKRDFTKAREAQGRAAALDPDSLDIRYNEVNLLEAEGKLPDAIAKLKDMLDSTAKKSYTRGEVANRAVLQERLGLLYVDAEQYPQAVDAFRKVTELDPDLGGRVEARIIEVYRQAKDFARAEQEAETAYKKYPNDRTVKVVRASLLADLGRIDEAIAATRQLLDGRNDRDTWLALAQIYDKGKRYPEMTEALDQAEKLSTTDEDKETVYFLRGAMFEKQNKVEAAEAEFRKVLAINPQNASALNYLGYMLADRNLRLAEAQKYISRAVELEPNNSAYLDSLGWVKYRLGKLDEAETYLRQSLERVSNDPTVHDHLGDVYLQAGKLKEAIAQWEMSLKDWQNSARAEIDPAEVAKVQKKLETARVRLAQETGSSVQQR